MTSSVKDYKGQSLVQTSFTQPPNRPSHTVSTQQHLLKGEDHKTESKMHIQQIWITENGSNLDFNSISLPSPTVDEKLEKPVIICCNVHQRMVPCMLFQLISNFLWMANSTENFQFPILWHLLLGLMHGSIRLCLSAITPKLCLIIIWVHHICKMFHFWAILQEYLIFWSTLCRNYSELLDYN